jgi:colicin import membrane protein
MVMSRRRKGSGVTDFLSNVVDDIKDFVDDEIIDRGRDSERDVRRAAADLTDERNGSRLEEIGELRNAIRSLAGKVEAVAASKAAAADKAAAAKAAADKAGAESAAPAKPAAAKQPWPRYDEQTVVEIRIALAKADRATLSAVRAYEAGNKKRQGVLKAASAL